MATRSITLTGSSDGKRFIPDEPGRWIGFLAYCAGKRMTVTAERERLRRTNKQNSRYWALIVPVYQEWVGEENKLVAHSELLSLCNKDSRILPTGEVVEVAKGSRFLSVEEFNEYTNRCEMWMAKHGIEFPEELS